MKQDIKEISYTLTKTEELKLEKERQKKLLNDFKQDIKYILLTFIQTYYEKDNKFYDVISSKDEICEKTENEIKGITVNVEKTIIENDVYKKVKTLTPKYKEYTDFDLSVEIDKQFMTLYKQFKQLKSEELKLAEEQSIEIAYKDLCEYYDYLSNQGYTKAPIMQVLEKDKQKIIADLRKTNTAFDFNDKIYKKAMSKVKEHYFDEPPRAEQTKIPLGWKMFFGLKIIEKLKKHL